MVVSDVCLSRTNFHKLISEKKGYDYSNGVDSKFMQKMSRIFIFTLKLFIQLCNGKFLGLISDNPIITNVRSFFTYI